MNRQDILAALRKNPEISVLIVGAGINGIGTFRDLALNGVDVLLVDREDFCSGASAASSHMAHGGIRYLENGEFRLVREAVRERNRLIRNAPHLVRPLPTTVPSFRLLSGIFNAPLKFLGLLDRPSERGSLVIKIGLLLYDAYTGRRRAVPRHRFLNRKDSLARWGRLNPNIKHTATYFDGAILEPERLGLELILEAEANNARASALNYVALEGEDGPALLLRDQLTAETYEVRPRLLINATGPWIDRTNRVLGHPTRFIGGTKGSHLVLDHPDLRDAIGDHEFFFENKDGRIVLIFPLYDRVLVGTSDVAVDDPDGVRCTDEEVDYFLEMIGRVFPSIDVSRSHIVFRFSGVRPLAAQDSRATGQITRDHALRVIHPEHSGLPFPTYSLVGGKWTSFRAFSEQAADSVLAFLGLRRQANTRDLPIGGGRGYPLSREERQQTITMIAARARATTGRAEALLERYGTRAMEYAGFIADGFDAPLSAVPAFSHRELGFMVTREKVVHTDDVLLRRSMLAMLGQLSQAAVAEIAEVAGAWLGWAEEQRASELERTLEILRDRHQVIL